MSSLFTMISELEPEKDRSKKKVTFKQVEEKENQQNQEIPQTDKSKPNLVITEHFESKEGSETQKVTLPLALENYFVLLCLLIISLHPSKFLLKYLSAFKQYDYIALSVLIVVVFYGVCLYNES